jgi:protein O-mannosyl-transferase
VLLVGLLVVALAAATAHWTALSARAISFDDNEYLLYNSVVQNPSWASAGRFLQEVLEPSTVHGYYQPLTMISLMLDYASGGRPDNLMPFHRTSLILHTANTVLIVLLLYQLFGNPWAAACVGLLFGVHPITVETIPWIGERKTLLAAFFALLSLIAYVRYARTGGYRMLAVCSALYVLALMSKPTSTPLPACMLLLDFWPLRRLSLKAVLEKVPLFVVTLVSAYITYESQKRTAITVAPGDWGDPWRVPLTLCHNVIFYLRQFAWPRHLTSHYPPPWPIRLSNTRVLLGAIGTAILIPALLLSLLRTRVVFTGWLYFFVMIFPAMGIIGFTNVIAADKFAYLPAVGLMLPVTFGLDLLWRRGRSSQVGVVAVTGMLAVILAIGTRVYLRQWRDTETLFRYMIEREPGAPTLRFHLAHELSRKADLIAASATSPQAVEAVTRYRQEAVSLYRTVTEQLPSYEEGFNNLGVQLLKQNHVDEAIECYRKVLTLKPDHVMAINNLANALLHKNQVQEAEELYRKALQIKPDSANACYNLGNVLAHRGDMSGAMDLYHKALALDPNHLQTIKNLAGALLREGRVDEAVARYDEALRKDPDGTYWGTISNLAWDMLADRQRAPWRATASLKLAELACRATEYRQPAAIGALAAATAVSGDIERGLSLGRQAIQTAQATGQQPLVVELRKRLNEYLSSQASTAPSSTPAETDDNR